MANEKELEIYKLILSQGIDENIPIVVDIATIEWSKSLKDLPFFTIREIEEHKQKCGKNGMSISKTSERGLQFKNERYLSADSIETFCDKDYFKIKGVCYASMKKEKRFVSVDIARESSEVAASNCTCPAGNSGYCNHIMALLYEIADYSLNRLQNVPEEVACTSRVRQWGIPGEKSRKAPVLQTTIQRSEESRGIFPKLYDPRISEQSNFKENVLRLSSKLYSKDKRIGFAHCVNYLEGSQYEICTEYGTFSTGAPLSYQLHPYEFDIRILTNIASLNIMEHTIQEFVLLPLHFIDRESETMPLDWTLTCQEKHYFDTVIISQEDSQKLERDSSVESVKQNLLDEVTKGKIISNNSSKIFIRKKNFETIVDTFFNGTESNVAKEQRKYNEIHHPEALEVYRNILRYKLK